MTWRNWRMAIDIRILALVGAVWLVFGAGMAIADTSPIEGTWNLANGQVLVQAQADGGYQGVVVQPVTFGSCTHPIGQVIWQIYGSGLTYTGTHVWYTGACVVSGNGQATWDVTIDSPTEYTVTFCTAHPGDGPPDPSATPTDPVGATLCYDLTRQLSPAQTPPAPADTVLPAISGRARAGGTVTCSTGTWTNSPASYTFTWSRDGTPISGATARTYTIGRSDEGLTLTCTVTAFNLGGAGRPATSGGVVIPVAQVPHCPAATGKVTGRMLGLIRLGATRAQVRHAYAHSSRRAGRYEDVFCLTPLGVQVGYASPALTRTLRAAQRKALSGRAVWALTANGYYAVHGIRPGAAVSAVAKVLKLGVPHHVGMNTWYLAPNGASAAIFEVRDGLIEEIGIADNQILRGRAARRALLHSLR